MLPALIGAEQNKRKIYTGITQHFQQSPRVTLAVGFLLHGLYFLLQSVLAASQSPQCLKCLLLLLLHYEQPLGTLRVQAEGGVADGQENHVEAERDVPKLLRAEDRLQREDLRHHHANGEAHGAADAQGATLRERRNLAVVHGQRGAHQAAAQSDHESA